MEFLRLRALAIFAAASKHSTASSKYCSAAVSAPDLIVWAMSNFAQSSHDPKCAIRRLV
jgi:hypothetical protein